MNEDIWKNKSKTILKSELSRKDIDYIKLSEKLAEIGVDECPANLNSKINRGTFSFAFFLQCMQAINTHKILFETKEDI